MMEKLVPKGDRTYDEDVGAKAELLERLQTEEFADEKGVLILYESLINDLAKQAKSYYQMAIKRSFTGYTEEQEVTAITSYITTFQNFVKKNEAALKADKFK